MAQNSLNKPEAVTDVHQTSLTETDKNTVEQASPDHRVTTNPKLFRRYRLAYGLSQSVLGAVFGACVTYVGFQIQTVGFVIGHAPEQPPGSGCPADAVSCQVPFGGNGEVNLTSALIYLQAISYAVSGVLTIIIAGIGDRMEYQREQYVLGLIVYGAFALPMAALTGLDQQTFNTLAALYTTFNIVGFLAGTWAKIFIPFVMHRADDDQREMHTSIAQHSPRGTKSEVAGLLMSLWGNNSLNIGQIVVFVIVIGLTYTSSLYAGLYVTTATGGICIIGSLLAWRWLPTPTRRPFDVKPTIWTWVVTPFEVLKDLFTSFRKYPEAAKFLFAFTVYVDSVSAFDSVRSQLFNLEIRPDVREFTAYTLVQPIAAIIAGTIFVPLFPLIERRLRITLRHWTAIGIAVNLMCTVWCCIGISDSANFGLKYRWEFYVMSVLRYAADGVITVVFSVLYAQLFPRGSEIEYFGFQNIVSCSTVWIPQVVNGPIVDATNIIRLPAVICTAFLLISMGMVFWVDEVKGMKDSEHETEPHRPSWPPNTTNKRSIRLP